MLENKVSDLSNSYESESESESEESDFDDFDDFPLDFDLYIIMFNLQNHRRLHKTKMHYHHHSMYRM